MELGNMGSNSTITSNKNEQEDDIPLPGFRFHPTDEELVGFYLRRKVEKRPISLDLIKLADIYKYDPWDLPKSSDLGDNEWYFFCKRGRKYRNSIRPNRVTGTGFWKATGIDRPIYASGAEGRDCIGLKKSLVYYRGRAGKGTKTEWMMHEFRLPTNYDKRMKHVNTKSIDQEVEVWTLCRVLKRNISYRMVPDLGESVSNKRNIVRNLTNNAACSEPCSLEYSTNQQNVQINYVSFNAPVIKQIDGKPCVENIASKGYLSSGAESQAPTVVDSCFTTSGCIDINELLRHADWEDLQSLLEYASTNTNNFTNYHKML